MGMYESPIKIIYGQMQTQLEGDILKAVMSTDIQVDKEELTRALQYDREQYERGFIEGHMTAQKELIRCKDCKHWHKSWLAPDGKHEHGYCHMEESDDVIVGRWDDDFCSYGERKTDG